MAPYHITTDKCLAKVYRLWPSVAHRTTRSCRTRSWWSTTARSFGRWRGCRFESPTEESGLGRTWLKNKVRFYILGFFWVSTRISCSIGRDTTLMLFFYSIILLVLLKALTMIKLNDWRHLEMNPRPPSSMLAIAPLSHPIQSKKSCCFKGWGNQLKTLQIKDIKQFGSIRKKCLEWQRAFVCKMVFNSMRWVWIPAESKEFLALKVTNKKKVTKKIT